MFFKTLHIVLFFIPLLYAESLLQKANDFYQDGDYNSAIRTYYKALEKGENPALAYFNLANTYYQTDSVAKAIVYYQLSIGEAPEFFRAYLNLGILYYNLNDMAGAISTLERARLLKKEHDQLLLILASAYKNLNEYSVAVLLLEKIIEKNPRIDECYFLLFEINRIIGDIAEAQYWLEKYPEEGKRVADKYQLLGELSEEMGNKSEAIFYYNQLINISPKRKWAYYRLVKLTYLNGNILTALQEAEKALRLFDDFSDLSLFAGNVAFENKIFRKAEKFYSRAYKTGSTGGLVGLQNLLKYYHMQHDHESALRIVDLISHGS